MYADTIFVLEKGKIAKTGSYEGLLDQKGLYYAMWRQQIGERKTMPIVPAIDSFTSRETEVYI